tara:strand:- start:4040 stop:4444 length:405 start_codon:yes stop_codon:yes gene_type:complete
MPTLHLKIVPNSNSGINKVFLSNPIRSQNLTLQSAIINKVGSGYAKSQIYIRLPFLSANQFHSGDKLGFLSFPTQKSTAGIESYTFGGGLKLETDHIPEVFEAQLLDEDMSPLTSTTHFTSIDLYFSYESHSLF